MPGKGLRFDPISQIRANLRDRYTDPDGFTLVKEVLQNAEDAGATVLHIGWLPGLPGASHPLLRTPALFFLNDERFTDRDADAIRWFGSSPKPGEEYRIGKFGLGLKSVFHVCEAFFFAASSDSTPDTRFDIVNPWSGD